MPPALCPSTSSAENGLPSGETGEMTGSMDWLIPDTDESKHRIKIQNQKKLIKWADP